MTDLPNLPDFLSFPIEAYLSALSSDAPAPGGGSAAALAGALAAALGGMVARLTISRPRYAAAQEDMLAWRERADQLQKRLAALVTGDAVAYNRLVSAQRLPNQTPEEKAQRSEAVQAALRGAVEVPLSAALACADVLELLVKIIRQGNKSATSDAAVAALLAHAALRSAVLNVLVNLNRITDEKYVRDADALVAQLMSVGRNALAEAMAAVEPEE